MPPLAPERKLDRTTADPVVQIRENTLAFRNNNPGNLRYAKQRGAVQGEGGFAAFATPKAGYQALIDQILLDTKRGHTLESFLAKYAPPSENDTEAYLKFLETRVGSTRVDPLEKVDLHALAQAIALMESGTKVFYGEKP